MAKNEIPYDVAAIQKWAEDMLQPAKPGITLTELAIAILPSATRRDALIHEELTRLRDVEKLSQAVVTLAFSNNHLDQEAPMWNALHALRAALGKEG